MFLSFGLEDSSVYVKRSSNDSLLLFTAEERRCIQKSLLSCSLTEEQSRSGDEEDDGSTETD